MKRPVFLIFVNSMILIVVLALLTQSLFAVQRKAQARAVTGHVEIQHGSTGEFHLLARGEAVQSGDSIRTGAGGNAEFSWAPGTSWTLLPRTLVKVRRAIPGSTQRPEHSLLELSEGQLQVRIAPDVPHALRFEVRTPSSLCRAQEAGSIFSVRAWAGHTQARVSKGTLSLFNKSGQKAVVAPGEVGAAQEDSVETKPDGNPQDIYAAAGAVAQSSLPATQACAATR